MSGPRTCACGRPATALCDWKVPAHASGYCNKAVCVRHAKQVSVGKFLCPEHQAAYEKWQERHPPKQRNLFEEAS